MSGRAVFIDPQQDADQLRELKAMRRGLEQAPNYIKDRQAIMYGQFKTPFSEAQLREADRILSKGDSGLSLEPMEFER